MFQNSAQAACRLPARRRLALGGLALSTALVAGAFVSTPAFAADATEVSDFTELQNALAAHDSSIKLTADIAASNPFVSENVGAPTKLDLAGFDLSVNVVAVQANASLSVIDSTATADAGSNSNLDVSANSFGAAITAVQLAAGSTFHVTDVDVDVIGTTGGAGIGGDAATASFIADGFATVASYGTDNGTAGGAAGIGGTAGHQGINVTVSDSAQVRANGGLGAAGIGGGFGGAGGVVRVSGALQAHQGQVVDPTAVPASSIGAGEDATALGFGSLRIDDGGSLALSGDTPLVLPGDAVVQNAGIVNMNPGYVDATGHAVRGTGTIENSGSIDTSDADGNPADPDTLIDTTVKVKGNNYRLAVDANGGAITGATATSRHLLSNSLRDLLGYGYSVTPPSSASLFWKWNTKTDGSGTDVSRNGEKGDLSALGTSTDGTPVTATLYADYARTPITTASSLPDATVGTAYSAKLPVSGDGIDGYYESYGSEGLPAGLALNSSTGVLSGTPTEAINRNVTVRVNGALTDADLSFHLTVKAAAVTAPSAPVLVTSPKATVKIGQQLRLVVGGTNSSPATYRIVSGSLPKGLRLDAATGVITGSPSGSGTYAAVVQASNASATSSTTVVIVVPKVKDLIDNKSHVPAVKVGAANVPLKVAGFKKGEHWTVKVDGKVVKRGTMKKAGALSVSVHLKKARKDKVHTITIAGSRRITDRSTRAATEVKITSLAAKKTLKVHTVSANGRKLVAVEKLAAGERIVVKDGKKVIATGHANQYGIFAFPASKAGKGTSKVTVHGAAVKRAGKLTVKNAKR